MDDVTYNRLTANIPQGDAYTALSPLRKKAEVDRLIAAILVEIEDQGRELTPWECSMLRDAIDENLFGRYVLSMNLALKAMAEPGRIAPGQPNDPREPLTLHHLRRAADTVRAVGVVP